MATTEDRAERAARNQSLFRQINERIIEITAGNGVPAEERWDFLCECCDASCGISISLTLQEYEDARRLPTRFPVAPGHNAPDIERVVEEHERYAVVEKFGEAGLTAVELDPRRDGAAA